LHADLSLTLSAPLLAHGHTPVLQDVALHLQRGERWAVVGPNGAGKSTLLRAVAGLHSHSQHSINARLGAQPLQAKQVAWFGQLHATELSWTPEEVVTLGLESDGWRGMRASWQTLVDEWLGVWGLTADRHKRMYELSGGQQRRAFLARTCMRQQALVCPIMLLDEPLAQLDVRYQHILLQVLTAPHHQSSAQMLVAHDIAWAAAWATHILVLGHGRILSQGHWSNANGAGA
jgi:iron complex transport system ATP-binding protein